MTYADNPKVREAFYTEDNDFTRCVKFYGIVGGDIRAMAECVLRAAAVHEASRETDAEPVAWAVFSGEVGPYGVFESADGAWAEAHDLSIRRAPNAYTIVPLYRHPAPRVAAPVAPADVNVVLKDFGGRTEYCVRVSPWMQDRAEAERYRERVLVSFRAFTPAVTEAYTTEEIVKHHGDPIWEAIWCAIKRWDIQREPGIGYAGATGDDAQRIFDAVISALSSGGGTPRE